MKLTFISKSDLKGGAAIVTFRLVAALRAMGVDARMIVAERLSDAEFVQTAASPAAVKAAFLAERLQVFAANGFQRKSLFQVDPSSCGLPLWKHPWVEDADAVFLGWVNQGLISLRGIKKIAALGKPLVWMMHDMWNMTGICHHAGSCKHFLSECGDCPFLGCRKGRADLSHIVWKRKAALYRGAGIRFVAVSSWLAGKARESSLLRNAAVEVIPNAFPLEGIDKISKMVSDEKVRMIFGAARLDDPIKGLPVLKGALEELRKSHPEIASRMELVTFGSVKDPASLEGFALPHTHLGVIRGEDAVREAYASCSIVVSSSDFETLPGTLVEGQAYGCIPVAFDHGGQRDIISHKATGWLAPWSDDAAERARSLAEGIAWAFGERGNLKMRCDMRESVKAKFSPEAVAAKILALVKGQSPR